MKTFGLSFGTFLLSLSLANIPSFGQMAFPGGDPATAAQDLKTPAQWLEIVKAATVEEKKYEAAHPDETRILYGATQAPNDFSKADLASWPAAYREGYAAYTDWWKTEGEAAFNKWRQAGFPATNDKRFLIFHAVAMGRFADEDRQKPADKDIFDYGTAVVKRGKELMLKGCSGGSLSRSDIADLRLYAMYNSYLDPGSDYPLPSLQGMMPSAPNVGDPERDFTLPRMDEILARPTYSDADPFDEMHLFRPNIMLRCLQVMTGYESTDDAQKKLGILVQPKPYAGEFKDPLTLSSFKGKKPVLFMCEDPVDTWDWSGEVLPLFEPFYQAIKDKVEVFMLDTTVHDQLMPGRVNVRSMPGTYALHPVSMEARARTAKMAYMTYPDLSVPYVLDDLPEHAVNAYVSGGGETSTLLIDKAGIISYSQWQLSACSAYMWLDCEQGNPFSLPARHERVMNLIESNVKALLDAGGVWNKNMKPVIPDWQLSPFLVNVPLVSIDAAKGQITTTDKNKAPITIAVDGQSRILRGEDHKTLADLKTGETASIYYDKDGGGGWIARLIVAGGAMDEFFSPDASWVPAVVQSVDVAGGVLKAKLTLDVAGCKGGVFWKTASPEMSAAFGEYAKPIPQKFNYLASHANDSVTIHIDRATEMFLDGMTAKLADLKPGDQLGLELPNNFQPDNVWLHFIRVYRY